MADRIDISAVTEPPDNGMIVCNEEEDVERKPA
jgi:hypothetical protein